MRFIGNVEEDTQIRAVASGTLSNGDTVVVNSDGTVSAVSGSSASASTSSPATFNTQTSDVNVIYDSVNDKIVMVYRDNGNSNYGTAIVGTLSGSTITFGSETVFNTATVEPCFATYDPNAGKVIAVYRDGGNSNYGTAVVGTVSGTSISFGSKVVFNASATQAPRAVYDASSQKIVIVYRDQLDGGDGTAIVGTVSGTSISFGTEVDFSTTNIGTSIDLGYDSDTEQVVIAYRDYSNSNYGTAIVGKVSGTSITFGTKTVFSSVSTYYPAVTYDTTEQKILISYYGTSGHGKARVGTVSGTGISFGTEATFNTTGVTVDISAVYDSAAKVHTVVYQAGTGTPYTGRFKNATISGTSVSFGTEVEFETGTTTYIGTGFDSTANKVIIGYRDQQNTDAGTYVVRQNAYTSTNVTAENFIGFADSGYLSGQNVGIDSTGSVNRSQSGLTAGQKYYVQNDGSLSTTADDPSVEAGVAISATEILVKG